MTKGEETQLIKSYEPMMHKLLRKYKVKRDYEDILQELRLKTFEAIREYEKSTSKKKAKTKLITFVHACIENRLRNILRINYRVVLDKSKQKEPSEEFNPEELGEKERRDYHLANPDFYADYTHDSFIDVMNSYTATESLYTECDLNTFKESLCPLDQEILSLKEQGFNHKEIAEKLEIYRTKVTKRLMELRDEFKEFLDTGEKRRLL